MGMDPFSAEIIGIKIQIAALMERVMQFQKAIDILEIVKKDNMRWIEELGGKEGNEAKRTWVLGKTVGVSVKLGELYAGEYVMEREKAEEALVWAVETVLRERIRREKEGVKEGEGEWLSREEIGGSFEGLFTSVLDKRDRKDGLLTVYSASASLRGERPALPCRAAVSPSAHAIPTFELPCRCPE